MHLENVVIRVCQLDFNGLAARASVHNLIRQQGIALWRCGFLDGDVGVKGQVNKKCFTVAVRSLLICFRGTVFLVTDLECAALQRRTIFISLQYFKLSKIFRRLICREADIYTHLPYSRLHHDNRLYARTGCAGCIYVVTVYIHAGKELGFQGCAGFIHLLRCGLGDTEQEGFTISHTVAVFVQVIVFVHMGQRKPLRTIVIIALVALAVHEESTVRDIVCTDKNLPIFALAAHKGCACRRHRQYHVLLPLYLLLRKGAAGYDTAAYIDRTGLLRCGSVLGVAGRVIDGSAYPRRMAFAAWPPSVIELIAILQHFYSGKQRQRFRRGTGAKRLAGSAITERRGAAIAYAIAAVCSNLRIAQRTPDRGLTGAEVHIFCKIFFGKRASYTGNKFIERHTRIAARRDAIHMHIRYAACHRVRHSRCAGVALAVVRAVCADLCAV